MAGEKSRAIIAALMGQMPLPIRPFDPKSDVPQDMGLGGMSTEILETFDTPHGDYVNVPSMWYLGEGQPFRVDDPIPFAHDYEVGTGQAFPRYDTLDDAVSAALMRSGGGGAEQISIVDPRATVGQRLPLFGMGLK